MADYIRRLVSGQKARFKDEELKLELDLVYVTDQVIIMGYPASGFEGIYRNRRQDAIKFLESRHGNNYWVFNFCPIKENSYDKSIFGGRVSRYPFPDHHAPPMAIMPLVAREMRVWLSGSPDRVAVLHCKAGKGRSGTMACSYLLSLDSSPSPPRLQRSYGAKEWAKRRIETAIDILPPDEDGKWQTTPTSPPSQHTSHVAVDKPLLGGQGKCSNDGNIEKGSGAPVLEPSAINPSTSTNLIASPPSLSPNEGKSFVETLKSVLDLHTAQRMKAPSTDDAKGSRSEIRAKEGVSIPSQRRFLYYWALLLAHDAPSHFWAIDPLLAAPSRSLSDLTTSSQGLRQSQAPHPKVRLTQLKLRMRETGGVKMGIVKAANAIIEKTNMAKGPGKPLHSSTDSALSGAVKKVGKEKEVKTPSTSQIWASLARYDDKLVDTLQRWEVYTRDLDGNMGKRRPSAEHYPSSEGEDEVLKEIFEDGKWDKKKMVHSFARMGVVAKSDEKVVDSEKEGKVYEYTLRPLSDKRWEGLKTDINDSRQPDYLLVEHAENAGISQSEANSMHDVPSAAPSLRSGSSLDLNQGIVVDATREIRIKLYLGQVFMGWLWFIPTFHMPQPPSSTPTSPTLSPSLSRHDSSSSAESEQHKTSTKATFHLTRKDLDFPLGLGSSIVDIDIDLEWVVPQAVNANTPSSQSSTDVLESPESALLHSSDSGPTEGPFNAAVRIMVGGGVGEGSGGGALREAFEAKQAVEQD